MKCQALRFPTRALLAGTRELRTVVRCPSGRRIRERASRDLRNAVKLPCLVVSNGTESADRIELD